MVIMKKMYRFVLLVLVNDFIIMRGNCILFIGFSFFLGEGEIVGFCGDSGSGKMFLGDVLFGFLFY